MNTAPQLFPASCSRCFVGTSFGGGSDRLEFDSPPIVTGRVAASGMFLCLAEPHLQMSQAVSDITEAT